MRAGDFRFWLRISAVLWLLFGAASLLGQGNSAEHRRFVPQRLLVKLKPEFEKGRASALAAEQGASIEGEIGDIGIKLIRLPNGVSEEAMARIFSSKPEVEFAELDYLNPPDMIPNDSYYSNQWHLPAISAPEAWGITAGSSGVIIAILDTGVDPSHPDLSAKLIPGWNFYDNNSDTRDVYGHGTATAGTAAASGNNGIGVASVAMNCLIMPVRISDPSGWATDSAIATGLNWAANQGARVANISYAVSGHSAVSSAAQYFQKKGGIVAVSAGNDGTVSSAADDPYVLTVSATDSSDAVTSWSNKGSNIDLAAPGNGIYTTSRGSTYGSHSGTSFAAPIVAGTAALVISANPGLSGSQVQDILKDTADDLSSSGWDESYGWGRVNVGRAVIAALSVIPTNPPTVSITSPASGSTVSGTISVSVSASSSVGIASVSLAVDGSLVATDTTSPFTFSWNTAASSNAGHTLKATVMDTAGNASSASISVTVNNTATPDPPVVSISLPTSSSTVSGIVTVQVSAASGTGISSVALTVDGALLATDTSSPYIFQWATSSWINGTHNLVATAADKAGNKGSASIAVMVNNIADITPPTIAITSPKSGSAVSGNVWISVNVSDDAGIAKVQLYVDGFLKATSTSAPFTTKWSTNGKVAKGAHTLQCKAYDAAGNIGSSQTITVYK